MSQKASVLGTKSDASQILYTNFLNDPKKVNVYALEVVNQVIDDAVKVASIVKETGQSWSSIMASIYPPRITNKIDELAEIEQLPDRNHKTINPDILKMEGDLNIKNLSTEMSDGTIISPLEEELKDCIRMIETSQIQGITGGAGDVVTMWHAGVSCTNEHSVDELTPKGQHPNIADKRKTPKVAKVPADKDILDTDEGKDLFKGNESEDDETVIQFKGLSDLDVSKLSDKYTQMEVSVEKIEADLERTMQVIEPNSRDQSPIVKRPRLGPENSFQSPPSEILEKYIYENTFLSLNCERDNYYDASAADEADANVSSDVFEGIQTLQEVPLDESADGDKPKDPLGKDSATQPQSVEKRRSSYSLIARKKAESLKKTLTLDFGRRRVECAKCAEEKPSQSRGGSVASVCVAAVRRAWRALSRIFGAGGPAPAAAAGPTTPPPKKR